MFDQLKPLPPDAILGIMQLFRADEFPGKVDLSVGVYQDDDGNTPILDSVKRAEKIVYDNEKTKSYVAPAGNASFNRLVEELVFGSDSRVLREGRVATVPEGARRCTDFLQRSLVAEPRSVAVAVRCEAGALPVLRFLRASRRFRPHGRGDREDGRGRLSAAARLAAG